MNFEQTVETLTILPRNHSVLIMGPHGLGKSDAVREAGKILNVPVVDQRLSQCDVGDMKGMPFCIDGRTFFAPPEWFPLREEDAQELKIDLNLTSSFLIKHAKAGILFLDEIDRAPREVQQAAFELALDHRLNMRYLPEDWRVVSAVNADGDIYHVNEMDVAFIDRFFVIKFNPTREEWFKFARTDARIHSCIVEFLTKFPNMMDPTKEVIEANPGQKLYSRRSYEKLSQCLMNHEKNYAANKVKFSLLDKSPDSLTKVTLIAQGYLGTAMGVQFRNFIETDYQSLNGDTILNKWNRDVADKIKKIVDTKKIIELGSYNQLIINHVQDEKIKTLSAKQSKNLLSFIQCIPNECVADFWQKFQADCKEVANGWYSGSDRSEIVKRVVASLANPQTGRGVN
jgi:hypothetical protein